MTELRLELATCNMSNVVGFVPSDLVPVLNARKSKKIKISKKYLRPHTQRQKNGT